MSAPQPGFRRSMAWLHGWAGLMLGWLVFAIAASGTASVFKDEISDWMRPEITAGADQADAVAAALEHLAAVAPSSPNWYLTAPGARASATIAGYQATRADGMRDYRLVALDPVTGRPDGIRDTLGGEFLYRFHFELQLPYPWGRILASAAGMTLLVTLLSGIVTHRRIFADFFTLRTHKGKRSWLDAHNALGVFAMPFHLMIALTGVLTLVSLTLPWAASARYGSDIARYYAEATPGSDPPPASGRHAPAADVRAMLRDAVARFDGGRIGLVTVIHPGDEKAVLSVTRSDGDQLAYGAATARYAMASGRLLGFHVETRPAKRTYDVLYGLHLGRFAPVFAHWLYFLCGLALTATIATGLVLWTRSRDAGDTFGRRLVARLTVGTVAGMPLAIAAYFWANRSIPAALAERADWEVRSFFLTWAAALLAALACRPRSGWIALMALAGIMWLTLPLVSAVTTGRGLGASLVRHDWIFAGFDLVALCLGATACGIAWSVMRHRPALPRQRRAA